MKNNVEKIIKNLTDLPSLPIVVHKLIEVVGDDKSAARDLAEVISMDQALTAKVLKLVNSAFFGFSSKITTVSRSVVILGFHTIKVFALGVSVFETANSMKGKGTELNIEDLWEHSIAVAAGARVIARLIRYNLPEEVFIAGLLHDIGKIVFNQYLPKEFSRAVKLAKKEGIPLIDAEDQVLKVNHSSVGDFLGEKWRLPPSLRKVISMHHNPPFDNSDIDQETLKIICIVNLANSFCKIRHIGFSGDNCISKSTEAVLKKLNIHEGIIERFFLEIDNELVKAKEMLGVLAKSDDKALTEEIVNSQEKKHMIVLVYKDEEQILMPHLFVKSLDLDCQKIPYDELAQISFANINYEAVFTQGLTGNEIETIEAKIREEGKVISCFKLPENLNSKYILDKLGIEKDPSFYTVVEEEEKEIERRIMLIDADVHLTNMLKVALEKADYKVEIVNDPAQSIVTVRKFRPHVIVTDISFPQMSGVTLLKILICELKADVELENTEILIATTEVTKKLDQELTALGMSKALKKPFDKIELMEKLDNLLYGELS